jgi:hypothetical protein
MAADSDPLFIGLGYWAGVVSDVIIHIRLFIINIIYFIIELNYMV